MPVRTARSARPISIVLSLACVLIAGCSDFPQGSGVAGEAVRGGTAVIAGSHDLQILNGPVSDEQDAAEILKHALSTTLVRLEPDLDYASYAAESWEMEGDSAIVFHLRPDLAWHDGQPTTAHDVAFTFETVKDPESGSPLLDLFAGWEAAEVVDSFTIRFRVRPHPDPLYPWTELPLIPAHLLDTVPAARMRQASYNRAPVGNGPFRFVSHTENDRWVFEANPDFPESLGGAPYLDRLVWRVIPESTAQLAELRTGLAHLAMSPRTQHLAALRADSAIRVIEAPSNAYAFIGWNTADPILADVRVRRALTQAVDRAQILAGLRGGYGSTAFGPIPPGHWAHHPALEPVAYDVAAARELLEEAGWVDRDGDGVRENAGGQPLSLTLKIPAGVDYSRDLAEAVRGDLAEAGVRLETRALEAATLFGDITAETKDFQGVLLTLAADFRVDLRDTFHSEAIGEPFQLSSWSTPESDRLLDRITAARTREEAVPAWRRLQEVLREEQPWTFLYYAPTLRARRTSLRGVEVDARGTLVSLSRWWLDSPGGVRPTADSLSVTAGPNDGR